MKTMITRLMLFCNGALLLGAGVHARAAELKWIEPFEAARQAAKQAGKPMLVFVGDLERCKECKPFLNSTCSDEAFVRYAAEHLICTRVPYNNLDSKDERYAKSRILDKLNLPVAHALIITNPDGLRIGELSLDVPSVPAFVQDIKAIIAQAPPEGRLKYSEISMFDKKYVPPKSYKTETPEFSREPFKGRYFNFMAGIRVHSWENTRARSHRDPYSRMERDSHTPEIALKMRKGLAGAFPEARMTWAWSWHALKEQHPNYVGLRKLMVQFAKEYGDEVTFWPGVYFANKFNTQEQCKKDLHEGLELVSQMMGNGYRPQSVLAGHMSVESMKFLAEHEGIHVVQGQIWSQYNIDGQDGDGGILYPYYPSKDHFLKPAQDLRGGGDFVDIVNVDGWTVDFFAGRLRGMGKSYNSRVSLGPIETKAYYGYELGLKEFMYITDVHFNDEAIARNGFGFLNSIWELCLFSYLDPSYLPNYVKAVRAKYPDLHMLTLGEVGEKWRKHNPDNSRINIKLVARGNTMPSQEEGEKIHPTYQFHVEVFRPEMEISWYFNKDFRFATLRNWKENGPALVMDYTRYNQPYKEPRGNVIERHWDLLDLVNQKQSRPQDKPKPFTELPAEEQKKILKWYPELKP